MATPKKRNKKYNRVKSMDNIALSAAQNALNRIAFVGSSIRPLAPYGGRSFQLTSTGNMRIAVAEILTSSLFEEARDWRAWILHLYQDGEAITAESMRLLLPEYTLADFTEHADFLIEQTRDKEQVHYGYAIFASPTDKFDLDAMDEGLTENFMHSGILDKSQHLTPEEHKVDKALMLAKIVGYQTKFDVTRKHKVEMPETYVKTGEE
ncbi:hypothetical protein KWAN_142 [Erwinia phage vB_EamM_Kwan]|uniref:Uncharacterized protein n=1 Tax=Erwinia phage vB_EamM_Kwan TaxID=1883374 RepID=A0A1B2IE48_9CAUD|nr:hypothetical protein BIZ80_gp157 [Erwinia phage vB_EamM_Kwan]ANZ49494.1 hypothetical protein KWAN_142 [Erwinia phage vB_EamM_Kwan]